MAQRVPVFLAFLGSLLFPVWLNASAAHASIEDDTSADLIERGRYLVAVMDCGGCHDDGAFTGQVDPARKLAGSKIGFAGPWGVAYPPNLTPDPDTGLGRWSEQEILLAVRHGRRPDGRQLAPAMPWASYSALNEQDGRALAAYLRSIPPLHHQVPAPVRAGERAPSPYLAVVNPD